MVRKEDFETKTEQPAPQEFKINTAEMEAARRAQWRGAIEQELQHLVQEAATIRKKINEAKTAYKKTFYGKKFAKVQTKVMQMVAALQRFQAQDQAAKPAPVPHVHDEHCGHNHEEEKQNETAAPVST